MFGPLTIISPTPSLFGFSILYSTFGIGSPALSFLLKKSVFPATSGAHSVNPYPCSEFNPNLSNVFAISGFTFAAPTINSLSLPPNVFFTFVFTIQMKKIC